MRTAVLTVSTAVVSRKVDDEVGPLLAELADTAGMDVDTMEVVPHDFDLIEDRLLTYIDEGFFLVLTAGGSGIDIDDFVPEVTRTATDRDVPGIGEALRRRAADLGPEGMHFRGGAGIAGLTLIVNMPGTVREVEALFPDLAPLLVPTVLAMQRSRGTDPRA